MSGTSLDGIDLVYIKFSLNINYTFSILKSDTIPYPDHWKTTLKKAFYFSKEQLDILDVDYGNYTADVVLQFLNTHDIDKVDFIASHGHTIHHRPQEKYTLQIGDGQTIANKTSIKTICDFRTQDVALGGQGAPLVPIGDQILFSEYTYCLNLGGFANISFDDNNERIAFDICPVNTVLNHYANTLGLEYDNNGNIAASGNCHTKLFEQLNTLPFYKYEKPKSLGFEFVVDTILPLLEEYNLPVKDVLNTFVEHIAYQISSKIKSQGKVLITGGGVFNNYLIQRIKYHCKNEIVIPENDIINYKEALIFGFLGLRKLEEKVNCLRSVTGAKRDHSSGDIFMYKN